MGKKETWIGLVELRPRPGDGRLGSGSFGKPAGAFTNALAVVGSRGEFTEKVRAALYGMGFQLVDVQDDEPLAKRLAATPVPPAVLKLAKKAEGGGTVEFDDFHVYPETRRSGIQRVTPGLARAARLSQQIEVTVAAGYILEGAAVGVGRQLLLLHQLNTDAMTFAGYSSLPLREILRWRPLGDFRVRALERSGVRPSPVMNPPLDDLKESLEWAKGRYPLVVVYRERILPDGFWIGRIEELTDKGFVMNLVDRKASWVGRYRGWFKAVTRIDFGGPYESALASAVEEQAPARPKRRSVRAPR